MATREDIQPDTGKEDKTLNTGTFEDPQPKIGEETYREYRARIDALIADGFDYQDLHVRDYAAYCMGGDEHPSSLQDEPVSLEGVQKDLERIFAPESGDEEGEEDDEA